MLYNCTSQLNTWRFGLHPPKNSFAHVRNNGRIWPVIGIQKILKRKNQPISFSELKLLENVGFDISIEGIDQKTGRIKATIISTDFDPEDKKEEKIFKKLEDQKVLIQVY